MDNTPPEVSCEETHNPSGANVPKSGKNAGKSGQNPDGFYVAAGSDDSGVTLVLEDDGSDFSVALLPGDVFKLTQASGVEPNVKPGAGDVDHKIQFNGDATLVATDGAGNSASAACLVPEPPK